MKYCVVKYKKKEILIGSINAQMHCVYLIQSIIDYYYTMLLMFYI